MANRLPPPSQATLLSVLGLGRNGPVQPTEIGFVANWLLSIDTRLDETDPGGAPIPATPGGSTTIIINPAGAISPYWGEIKLPTIAGLGVGMIVNFASGYIRLADSTFGAIVQPMGIVGKIVGATAYIYGGGLGVPVAVDENAVLGEKLYLGVAGRATTTIPFETSSSYWLGWQIGSATSGVALGAISVTPGPSA